jgi:hypothetical protein
VPSVSLADAVIPMLAGAVKVAPAAGAVSDTVGAVLFGGLTVTLTGEAVAVAPSLSVATAVN